MKQLASVFTVGALACVLLAVPAGADSSDTVVRVFQLKYRSAAEASVAIQPLLSEQGSVTVQPQRATLTVQDQPEVLERVSSLLAELDHAPEPYRIRVRLLQAHSGPLAKGAQPAEVDARVRSMFHYEAYVELASTVVEGKVGASATVQLGPQYGLSFTVDEPHVRFTSMSDRRRTGERPATARAASPPPASAPWGIGGSDHGVRRKPAVPIPRLVLRDVVLWERQSSGGRDGGGAETKSREVVHSNMLLAPGQEAILGAGASEQSPTALILMLKAEPVQEK